MIKRIKYISLFFSFAVIGLTGYGQTSDIYSASGVLIVDSKYTIDSTRLNDFARIEKYVLPYMYNVIQYPDIAIENGVSGIVIVKLRVDSIGIELNIVKSNDYSLEKSVTKGINESMTKLTQYTSNLRHPFEFYIPFQFVFELDSYNEDLKKNNTVTINGKSLTKQYILIEN
jgi:hypothetical protein